MEQDLIDQIYNNFFYLIFLNVSAAEYLKFNSPDSSFFLFSGDEISRKEDTKNVLLMKVVKVKIEKN